MNKILRWMKKKPITITLRFNEILQLFFYYLFCWSVYGLSFSLLASAFTPVDFNTLIVFAGIYVFSIIIGFVTIVAPSGLGVREGVLFVFLSSYLDTPLATYLSILSRLWFTIVEISMIIFLMLWNRRGLNEAAISYPK